MQYVQLRTEKALNARLGQGTGMVRFSSSEKLDPSLPVYREHFSGRLLIDTSVPLFHMTESAAQQRHSAYMYRPRHASAMR